MNLIFLDTETTGLAPFHERQIIYPGRHELWNACRIVQIAWIVCNDQGEVVATHEYLIKPDGFIIPEESTRIHGITHDDAVLQGKEIKEVLNLLLKELDTCRMIVAHNVEFDYNVILSEIFRCKTNSPEMSEKMFIYTDKYCTMKHGTQKGRRWPKLGALYEEYFKCKPSLRLHSALNDTLICKDIYYYQLGKRTL